jgi:hypothetical protein
MANAMANAMTDMEMYRRRELEELRRAQMDEMREKMFNVGYAGGFTDFNNFRYQDWWMDPAPEDLSKAPRREPDRKLIPRLGVALVDAGESEAALAKEAESLLGYNVLRRKLKIPGKLGEVLACLDIEPLKFEAVEKYKADMVLWRKKEIVQRCDPGYGRTHRIDVSWRRVLLGACKEEVPLFALRKAVQVKKACPEVILEVDELIEEKKLIDPFLVARLEDEVYYLEVWKEPKFEETL